MYAGGTFKYHQYFVQSHLMVIHVMQKEAEFHQELFICNQIALMHAD